jgi:hypothetical protein
MYWVWLSSQIPKDAHVYLIGETSMQGLPLLEKMAQSVKAAGAMGVSIVDATLDKMREAVRAFLSQATDVCFHCRTRFSLSSVCRDSSIGWILRESD